MVTSARAGEADKGIKILEERVGGHGWGSIHIHIHGRACQRPLKEELRRIALIEWQS